MTTTLKDVARKAGVSIKTVSNVVHGKIHVTEERRTRVQAAINELNYQPNLPARFLRKGRVGIIALAIPELSNAYFSDLGNAIIASARERCYTVLLEQTGGDREQEAQIVRGFRSHLIDGVILSSLALEASDIPVGDERIPIVLLGERLLNAPVDHVVIDNVGAAYEATRHLIQLGRKRIAVIGAQETPSTQTAQLRLRGYIEAMSEAGLPIDQSLIMKTDAYGRLYGWQAMHQLLALSQPLNAVFCFNDLMALGAMRALQEVGLRIPEDVALVGFDDIEDSRFAVPSLTTISPDKKAISSIAVNFLLDRIEGIRSNQPEYIEVAHRLIPRESTLGREASSPKEVMVPYL